MFQSKEATLLDAFILDRAPTRAEASGSIVLPLSNLPPFLCIHRHAPLPRQVYAMRLLSFLDVSRLPPFAIIWEVQWFARQPTPERAPNDASGREGMVGIPSPVARVLR